MKDMRAQLATAYQWWKEHQEDVNRLEQENATLRAQLEVSGRNDREPDPRHRKTLLRIISALLDLAEVASSEPPKTTAHDINAKLELKGCSMKPDTIADVIRTDRDTD